MKNIEGIVIVITGASSGMGAVTARKLVQFGAKVVLAARREDRLLDQDRKLAGWLFNSPEAGKLDLAEFMERIYMFNVPMAKFAELTGRSLSTFQRDFLKLFGMPATA